MEFFSILAGIVGVFIIGFLLVQVRKSSVRQLARQQVPQQGAITQQNRPALTRGRPDQQPTPTYLDAPSYLWSARQLSESPHIGKITDKSVHTASEVIDIIQRTINSLPTSHREDVLTRRVTLEHVRRMRSTLAKMIGWANPRPTGEILDEVAKLAWLNYQAGKKENRRITIRGAQVPIGTVLMPVVRERNPARWKTQNPLEELTQTLTTVVQTITTVTSGVNVSQSLRSAIQSPKRALDSLFNQNRPVPTRDRIDGQLQLHNQLNEIGRWVLDENLVEVIDLSMNGILTKESELDRLTEEYSGRKDKIRAKYWPRIGDEIVAATISLAMTDISYDRAMHDQFVWQLQEVANSPTWFKGAFLLTTIEASEVTQKPSIASALSTCEKLALAN